MDYMVYLLNLRIAGIKCIEKEIGIDFYGKSIDRNFNPEKSRIKGIYGENGSGKSAIISAVEIVKEFILNVNYLSTQKQLNELINKNSKEFHFVCEYITNIESRIIFEYEVKLVKDENNNDDIFISYESLKYKENNSKNKQKTLFICEKGDFIELNISEEVKTIILDKTKNLLTKQSALYSVFSILEKNDIKEEKNIFWVYSILFFLMLNTHFDKEDKHKDYYNKQRIDGLKKAGLSNELLLDEIIKDITTDESRIPIDMFNNYVRNVKGLERFIRLFKPDLKKIDIEKWENKGYYECELIMDYGEYRVNKEFESTGIKKIMDLYNVFKYASIGGIVFIDELDSNINDIYLCKIIEYFKYYGKGQICFTSHNTDPMQVLKDLNKSIDFLARDNRIVPWVKNGHYSPDNSYRNGMIMGLPFNIDAADFIMIFEGAY